MSNLISDLKLWLCQDCDFEFQSVEPYRSATGASVCLACCSESFEVA